MFFLWEAPGPEREEMMDREKMLKTVEKIGKVLQRALDQGLKKNEILVIFPPILHSKVRVIYNIPFSIDLRILGVRCIAGNVRTKKIIITKIKAEVRID